MSRRWINQTTAGQRVGRLYRLRRRVDARATDRLSIDGVSTKGSRIGP